MPLHCRYCGAEYEAGATVCARCGAPKTRPAKLLDIQAEPDHWSRSLTRMLTRLSLATALLMALNIVLRGPGEPPIGLTFLNLGWILGALPIGLVYAAWQSAKPTIVRLFFSLAGAAVFWCIAVGLVVWANDPAVFAD